MILRFEVLSALVQQKCREMEIYHFFVISTVALSTFCGCSSLSEDVEFKFATETFVSDFII